MKVEENNNLWYKSIWYNMILLLNLSCFTANKGVDWKVYFYYKVHIYLTISKTFTTKQKIKIANSNNYVNWMSIQTQLDFIVLSSLSQFFKYLPPYPVLKVTFTTA